MRIQAATIDDIPEIITFIRHLAEFEKLSHEVSVTPELLRAQLFDQPGTHVIWILDDSQRVGFALYFYNFSTFLGRRGIYLEDLFVLPEFRRRGYGKYILTYLAELAVREGCGRLEWSVLDWNQSAIDFYLQLGAKPQDDWTIFRLTGKDLNRLAEKQTGEIQ